MAQLKGIVTTDNDGDSVIYYEGVRYEQTDKPAEIGDIVRSDTDDYSDVEDGGFYAITDERDGDGVYVDNAGDNRQLAGKTDDQYGFYNSYPEDFTVFRRAEAAEEPAVTPLTTAQLIEQMRTELADLERRLVVEQAYEAATNRPKVGDYAVMLYEGDDISEGTVVLVKQAEPLDYDGKLPFEVTAALTGITEWVGECRKLTPAEAKAALVAQIEEIFS